MSDTLIDERFKINAYRAEAQANKIGLFIIVFVTIVILALVRIDDPYRMLCILIATIGLAMGIAAFLQMYLLYRYENEE